MANYSKAFNFRGGFQVDEDTFLVRGKNVGIGSSVPSERLDVDGVVKARGLIVDSTDTVAITSVYVGFISATEIQAGIYTGTPENGGIATYYGDGVNLLNLPTSQWVDIDVGLGFTSIYAAGHVGVDTVDPRWPFQVGGTPFKTKTGPFIEAQDGVGIQDGNIYFSGIASARFKPGAGLQGFVGYGSYINTLNATELTTGAIPPNAYDDLIITEEVRAPKLTGIASTAINVTPDATLSFDTAVANELKAINRFISTEGYLQIGTDEDVSGVGDIEVVKSTDNANIYSISPFNGAQVLVGEERPGGSNRGFGGIRRGSFPSEPLTGPTDLDLVNYNTGNLNLYLHSGSGGQGATTGKIRFIYGQRDVSLFEVDKDGQVNLPSNVLVTGPLLNVGGSGYFETGLQLDGDLNVTTGIGSFAGDVEIQGDLTVGRLILSGITTIPSIETDFLKIGQTEFDALNNRADIAGVMVVDGPTGSVDITGSLESTTFTSGPINVTSIIYGTSLTGPGGFSVNSSGEISAPSITIANDASVNGTLSVLNLSANSNITSPGADIDTLNATSFSATNATIDSLIINTSFTADDINVTEITTDSIQANETNFTEMTAGSVVTGDISNNGSAIEVSDDIEMANNEISEVSTLTAQKLISEGGRLGIDNNHEVEIVIGRFDFGGSVGITSVLSLEVFLNGTDIGIGITMLKLGPS
jgi:hypothetical protein